MNVLCESFRSKIIEWTSQYGDHFNVIRDMNETKQRFCSIWEWRRATLKEGFIFHAKLFFFFRRVFMYYMEQYRHANTIPNRPENRIHSHLWRDSLRSIVFFVVVTESSFSRVCVTITKFDAHIFVLFPY